MGTGRMSTSHLPGMAAVLQAENLRDVPKCEALGGTEVRGRPWFTASDREKWHTVTEVLQKQNEEHHDGKRHRHLLVSSVEGQVGNSELKFSDFAF